MPCLDRPQNFPVDEISHRFFFLLYNVVHLFNTRSLRRHLTLMTFMRAKIVVMESSTIRSSKESLTTRIHNEVPNSWASGVTSWQTTLSSPPSVFPLPLPSNPPPPPSFLHRPPSQFLALPFAPSSPPLYDSASQPSANQSQLIDVEYWVCRLPFFFKAFVIFLITPSFLLAIPMLFPSTYNLHSWF